MKYWFCGMSFLLGLACFAQEPRIGDDIRIRRDVRIVSNREVDLSPIHEWELKPEGERPLKHWKKFKVFQIKGGTATRGRCVLKDEDGAFREVFLASMPTSIIAFIETLKKQERNIQALRSQIDGEQARVRRLDAVTPIAAGGSLPYVDRVIAQRSQANLDAVALKEKKEQLQRLEAEHSAMINEGPAQVTIYAMFTGQKYATLEVWDCGRQR